MRSKLFIYFAVLAVIGALMTACQDEISLPKKELVPGAPGTITLQLCNSAGSRITVSNPSVATRAEGNGQDNNEFLISNLSIALYPNGYNEETTQAVTLITFSDSEITTSSESEIITVTCELTRELEKNLFGDNESCKLFALANIPDELLPSSTDASDNKLPKNPTVSQLKNLLITSPFDTQKVQDSFVMMGEETVKYTEGTSGISGKAQTENPCELVRAAAKIRLNLRVPESIKVTPPGKTEEEEWFSVTDDAEMEMKCILSNGVKTANPYPVAANVNEAWCPASETDYFNGSLENEHSYHTFTKTSAGNGNEETGEGESTTDNNALYEIEVPLYTYPNSWGEDSEGTAPRNTSITLVVPWKQGENGESSNYYYQVPITPEEINFIVRNHSYTINLTVGMLGSLDPMTPLPLDDLSYQIVEWGEEGIDVDLNEIRYLVVNPNILSVYNEEDFDIPFYTSHPVEINVESITFERFAFINSPVNEFVGQVVDFTITPEQMENTIDNEEVNPDGTPLITCVEDNISTNQKVLKVHHPLTIWYAYEEDDEDPDQRYWKVNLDDNKYHDRKPKNEEEFKSYYDQVVKEIYCYGPTTYLAYSPYIIRITIQHEDNANFKETVEITHYPAMYIKAVRNPFSIIKVGNSYESNPEEGNVYVNGIYSSNLAKSDDILKDYILGNIYGIYLGSTNKNPNMYIITATQLSPEWDKLVIGDPRSLIYNNDLSGAEDLIPNEEDAKNEAGKWCFKAPALYPDNSGERTLTYYYPTMETAATENMIAPQFRVASSWGIGSFELRYIPNITSESPDATNDLQKAIDETRVFARRRAATYQEQGFPAGRWRLPTLAEFKYIVQLSIDNKIPQLFGTDNECYWTAQGGYIIDSTPDNPDNPIYPVEEYQPENSSSQLHFNVRPVYDEWYWSQYPTQYQIHPYETDPDKYKYTLGDMPRNAPIF